MAKVILFAILCWLPASAQNQIAVVSAANYQAIMSPGSLATVFGSSLSTVTESAGLDSSGQLPTQIAGTSVTFNGQAAALIYVSPRQINLVIPDGIQPGTADVRAVSPFITVQGTADIRKAAPSLFSSNGAGTGPGSILNAVTYAADPFLVVTPQNTGDDKRTRLAVYGTGIRLASRVKAQGQTDSGTSLDLAVEFAGAAPGFFGLDQVNVVVPPEADGLGVVHFSVTADTAASNPVDFTVSSLPANQIALGALTLSSSAVAAGEPVSATVSLNAPAPAGGIVVQLSSTNVGIVGIPILVTIPARQLSATVPIQTTSPTSPVDVQITASASGVSRTATLRVNRTDAPSLSSISVNPMSASSGAPVTATVTLSANTTSPGVTVALQSDNAALQVPATVTIPFGQATATFIATTTAVNDPTAATITASLEGIAKTVAVTLNPLFLLTLTPDTITGGSDAAGKVVLNDAAPTVGASVQLQSSDITTARPPGTVIILPNQLSVQFTIQTTPPVSDRIVSITATYRGLSQSKSLTVSSGLQGTITNLLISPATVKGGTPATGTITLARPAGPSGVRVSLSSDTVIAASVDMFVTVPSGQSSATFQIRTSPVASQRLVTITAAAGDSSKSATFTVN